MSVPVIRVSEVYYSVKPHFWTPAKEILRGVSFEVPPGEIFGFLGPNGAGKTTVLKAMLGLVQPDKGTATLFGEGPTNTSVRRRVGFMPERAYFPEYLTATELMLQHGIMAGLSLASARKRADEVLTRVGLRSAARERLGGFSKGMLQRAGLAQALIGDPELVIFDEPMSGLDPLGRYDVRELMVELRARGKTVFFSTHILPDVETLCDRVAMIVSGRVRRIERPTELMTDTEAAVEIAAEKCNTEALEAIKGLAVTSSARGQAHVFIARSQSDANVIIDGLRTRGASIVSVGTRRRTLEQVFVEESRGAEAMSKETGEVASWQP